MSDQGGFGGGQGGGGFGGGGQGGGQGGGTPPPGGFGGPPPGAPPPGSGWGQQPPQPQGPYAMQAQPSYTGGPGGGGGDASTMAILALILGGVSWVFGSILTAIPGAIIAKIELGKIERGESPAAGKTFAEIGFWASVVHIGVFVVTMVGMCCFWLFFVALAAGTAGVGAPH